jgi:hypothetical protein
VAAEPAELVGVVVVTLAVLTSSARPSSLPTGDRVTLAIE